MMKFFHCLTFSFLLLSFPLFSQIDFRAGWEEANPVNKDSRLSIDERTKVYQDLLDQAILDSDSLHQIYSYLYFSTDQIKEADFAKAFRYLVEAESVAVTANNPGWLGWISFKKGEVYVKMKNYEAALKVYEKAAALCIEATDSLCFAESLEQISIMHAMLDDFTKATIIHEQAMPLLEKFGEKKQVATALANFGAANILQKRYSEAMILLQRAIEIQRKLENVKGEAKAMNNLAFVYRKLGKYDLAIETFQQCIRNNLKNKIPENLVRNYLGMGATYEGMGDCTTANIYFDKYYSLKDSLMGAEAQVKIADLELKYESKQKELELEKSKYALSASQRAVERRNWFIVFGLFIVFLGIWRWRLQIEQAKSVQKEDREKLSNLTRILLAKNKQLVDLEEQILKTIDSKALKSSFDRFEDNIYKQHILTDADWSAFKIYFEKAYPGFLNRLRSTYPQLSDAEERLFLFIKLNLTTKEAAIILGISADSVKKTRNRLRKRLDLEGDVDLREFVHLF